VALRLEPHEPVADPGERREHDAVGEPEIAERPRIRQGAHVEKVAPSGGVERVRAVGQDAHLALRVHQLDEPAHARGGPGDREAAAVAAGAPGGADHHGEAVEVHEVHVPRIQYDPLLAREQAVHRLTNPRRGGGVDLALHPHDSDATDVVDGDFEGMWANPCGQGEFLGANIPPERLDRD